MKFLLALALIGVLIFVATFVTAPDKHSLTQSNFSNSIRPSLSMRPSPIGGIIAPPNDGLSLSVDTAPIVGKIPREWPDARACMVDGVACTELMDVQPRLCPVAGACDGEGRLLSLAIANSQ